MKQSLNSKGYLGVNLSRDNKSKFIHTHIIVAVNFLNHEPDGHNIIVDHINNNQLDNNVDNLNLISARNNCSKDRVGGSSKYVGVILFENGNYKKWRADIKINGKQCSLGYFNTEIEAAEIYNIALANIDKYKGNNKEFRKLIRA